MDLQVLDDLIAIVEAGSVTDAAALRNVTQPAFTRRLQSIEKMLGIQVIRRGSKPARPSDALLQNIEEIRALAYALRRLQNDLLNTANPERVLSIAALHAISLAHLPPVLNRLNQILPLSRIRLRAANRDECYMWLMTGQVRVMMIYETEKSLRQINSELVERTVVCEERMIPVCSTINGAVERWSQRAPISIPLVGYPEDSVLGTILRDEILTRSAAQFSLAATTEFSSAVLELCEHGLGIAWVPERLAAEKLASGQIVELTDRALFPTISLNVSMFRLHTVNTDFSNAAWDTLKVLFRNA